MSEQELNVPFEPALTERAVGTDLDGRRVEGYFAGYFAWSQRTGRNERAYLVLDDGFKATVHTDSLCRPAVPTVQPDSGTLREQIARALEETHLGGYGKSTWELMAAEVMAVVAPLVERLHQAERGQELLALALVDAHDELDEAQNRFLDLYNGTSGRQYSDMLRGMARRVGERRRDADRESKFRRASEIEMMAKVERLEESRFRWAEEAAQSALAERA